MTLLQKAPSAAKERPVRREPAAASSRTAPRGNGTRSRKRNGDGENPSSILAVDIGGTSLKLLASGHHTPVKIASGKRMTPARMVEAVTAAADGWEFEAVSIGYPGLVGEHGPHSEPLNLGPGWVGFDYAAAFGKPVKIINDAAMQALGSYDGGRMLFLGLGTGLGSTLITENVIVPLELGELPYGSDERLGLLVGRRGLKRIGKAKWRQIVCEMLASFARAFVVDYVVLGGGNAKLVKQLPNGVRLGHNLTAFRGGFRLWNLEDIPTLSPEGEELATKRKHTPWRVV
jgi:polyphosphate glucokinase